MRWSFRKLAGALVVFMWRRATLSCIGYDRSSDEGELTLPPAAGCAEYGVDGRCGVAGLALAGHRRLVLIVIAVVWGVRRAREQGEKPREAVERLAMPPSVK